MLTRTAILMLKDKIGKQISEVTSEVSEIYIKEIEIFNRARGGGYHAQKHC